MEGVDWRPVMVRGLVMGEIGGMDLQSYEIGILGEESGSDVMIR